jgi:hypothetical protein
MTKNEEEVNPDYVVVFSSDGVQARCYPESGLLLEKPTAIAYKLNNDIVDLGLEAYARKIYDDLHIDDNSQFKVTFHAGIVDFKEGDVFAKIGDLTINPPMTPRSSNDGNPLVNEKDSMWQIMEVTYTDKSTEVLVGPSYRSVFDIYGSLLQKCPEAPSPTEIESWKSHTVAVGSST